MNSLIFVVLLMAAWTSISMARFSILNEDSLEDPSDEDSLEDPSDEDSLEDPSDDEFQDTFEVPSVVQETNCCQRERNSLSIGVSDVTGDEISIDVGRCRRRCSPKGNLKRHEFQRILRENPNTDPIWLYKLHSGRRHGGPSCPIEDETCRPSSSRIEQVMTTVGLVSVTVTEDCECQFHPRNCRRQPQFMTLHKDSPFETTIDVGDCQGHCSHELGCRAIKTRSVSVEGPNGAECVSVVGECSCEPSCYRTSLFQHVYNYTSQHDPKVEVIDVGTCIGECEAIPSELCVLRESNGGCKMSLTKTSSRCAPSGIQELQVSQNDGSVRTLSTITQCGCH